MGNAFVVLLCKAGYGPNTIGIKPTVEQALALAIEYDEPGARFYIMGLQVDGSQASAFQPQALRRVPSSEMHYELTGRYGPVRES